MMFLCSHDCTCIIDSISNQTCLFTAYSQDVPVQVLLALQSDDVCICKVRVGSRSLRATAIAGEIV